MIRIIPNNSIALFDVESGKLMTKEQSDEVILNLFEKMALTHPSQIPLSKNGGNHMISVALHDDYLVPSYNMMSIPSLRSEFMRLLKIENVEFVKLDNRKMKTISEFHGGTNTDAKSLLPYSTLKIGTVGSRSTNRDMSFELIIDDMPTETILNILRAGVNIINTDKSNKDRIFGYALTCRSEIEQFCKITGKMTEYLEAVYAVEKFQAINNLKERYQEFGRIHNYKEETLMKKVDLAA